MKTIIRACLVISIPAFLFLITLNLSHAQNANIEGKMKGVVELGSDGFNSFIITLNAKKQWKLEKAEYGNSDVLEGLATEQSVLNGLKAYIQGFVDYGVMANNVHFVASSGAQIMRSIPAIISGLESLGYIVNTVDEDDEGRLGFICIMSGVDNENTYVIDVGAGNTKVSWLNNGEIVTKTTYGSKYYLDFTEDEVVYGAAKEIGAKVPEGRAGQAYLIGGVPFKFAKRTRKDKERYTTLNPLESYEPSDDKEKGGRRILRGLRDGSGSRRFIFDWDSNFTIGFLLDLPY